MRIETDNRFFRKSDNHRFSQNAAEIFNRLNFWKYRKFTDRCRLRQRILRRPVVMASRSADIGGEKSAKGTKSHPSSDFLLCRRSPVSAGNSQIPAAENRAGFHWG